MDPDPGIVTDHTLKTSKSRKSARNLVRRLQSEIVFKKGDKAIPKSRPRSNCAGKSHVST
jgi:hypothetical protein